MIDMQCVSYMTCTFELFSFYNCLHRKRTLYVDEIYEYVACPFEPWVSWKRNKIINEYTISLVNSSFKSLILYWKLYYSLIKKFIEIGRHLSFEFEFIWWMTYIFTLYYFSRIETDSRCLEKELDWSYLNIFTPPQEEQ